MSYMTCVTVAHRDYFLFLFDMEEEVWIELGMFHQFQAPGELM